MTFRESTRKRPQETRKLRARRDAPQSRDANGDPRTLGRQQVRAAAIEEGGACRGAAQTDVTGRFQDLDCAACREEGPRGGEKMAIGNLVPLPTRFWCFDFDFLRLPVTCGRDSGKLKVASYGQENRAQGC